MDPVLHFIDRCLSLGKVEGETKVLHVTYASVGDYTSPIVGTSRVQTSSLQKITDHIDDLKNLALTDLIALGSTMMSVTFPRSVWQAFARDLREAHDTDRRLRLHINDRGSIASGWPWEFLWAEQMGFLALHPSCSIVRTCESVSQELRAIPRPHNDALDILIVWADPGESYQPLDAAMQIETILRMLSLTPRELTVRLLTPRRWAREPTKLATLENVRSALNKKASQIVCFFTHGEFDEKINEGVIVLESNDPGQTYRRVSAAELFRAFAPYANTYILLFDGCESANRGPHGNGLSVAEAVATPGRTVITRCVTFREELTGHNALM